MPGEPANLLEQYVDILLSRGIDWGLVGPREGPRIWERHVLNSIALEPLLPTDASVVDVGSGAGLPGIPLAIVRPDLRVTLLEPMLRRSSFLELSVAELGLADRVEVIRARAQDHRARYDVVTARAVAELDRLVQWCAHLLAPNGRMVVLKGASAPAELDSAQASLGRLGLGGTVHELAIPGSDERTWAVEVRRAPYPDVSRETGGR